MRPFYDIEVRTATATDHAAVQALAGVPTTGVSWWRSHHGTAVTAALPAIPDEVSGEMASPQALTAATPGVPSGFPASGAIFGPTLRGLMRESTR
jgi:hypothetical protein